MPKQIASIINKPVPALACRPHSQLDLSQYSDAFTGEDTRSYPCPFGAPQGPRSQFLPHWPSPRAVPKDTAWVQQG